MSIQDVPAPTLQPGCILVQNAASIISSGTERTSVQTAGSSLVKKALLRPDLVAQVLDSAKREGFVATYKKVQNRLDNYKELGYSSAGVVLESAIDEFRKGDRVACAGSAYHAEVVSIPKHLAAHIPEEVGFEEAALTTLGAIALQGVRQADVRIGERVAVIGLGLIGCLTAQILKASGCKVIGIDVREDNFGVARQSGCDEVVLDGEQCERAIFAFTKGRGTDSVIITAGTSSNRPVELALASARKKSNVVIVGAVGLTVPRGPFYEKEVDLRIASSYGPGRYDPQYEEQGIDYPVGYVRWTENRNMQAVLELIAEKKLNPLSLITHRFDISAGLQAYDVILGKTREKAIGVLLKYPGRIAEETLRLPTANTRLPIMNPEKRIPRVGFIGAGNFAQSYLIPLLRKMGVLLSTVATRTPIDAKMIAERFDFEEHVTDASKVVESEGIDAVVIATRHDSHAGYVINAINRKKHVFVEKPLAINQEELESVREAYESAGASAPVVMVGFNRRFSAPFRDIKRFFEEVNEPLSITYRVNAGLLPQGHWMNDALQGGRIVGECCHFIDTMMYLTGSKPSFVSAVGVEPSHQLHFLKETLSAVITFEDGSVGTLIYLTNGDAAVAKEYCEVSGGGRSAILDNFKSVMFSVGGKKSKTGYDGKKGHWEEMEEFVAVLKGRKSPALTFESEYLTTMTTFRIIDALRKREVVKV